VLHCGKRNRRRSHNAATKAVVPAHPIWCAVSAVRSRVKLYPNRLLCALGLYQTLHDAEVVNQPNRKRCWSTALQKLLLQSFTVETQRVGRARSPLRAGVARADPGFRFESGFPRPYGRGYEALVRWWMKNTLLILDAAGRGLPALPNAVVLARATLERSKSSI